MKPFIRLLFNVIAALTLFSFLIFCLVPSNFVGKILFGWYHFLARVVPEIKPDAGTVFTAVVGLLITVFGIHSIAKWLYQGNSPTKENAQPQWKWSWTVRIVFMLLLSFIVGIAAVGITHQVTWLATSNEPIYVDSMRNVVAKMNSQNNMKQHVLTVQNIGDWNNPLPSDKFTKDGKPLHSWQTQLLPYLEKGDLFQRIKLDQPWNHPDNRDAVSTEVKVFLHPGADSKVTANGLPATHYAANVLSFGGEVPRRLRDYERVGSSNTILIGEAVRNVRSWADPLNGRDPRLGLNHPKGFGGPARQSVTQFAMADGSVSQLKWEEVQALLKMYETEIGAPAVPKPANEPGK